MTETADEQEAILREGVGLKLELSREELGQKAAEEGKEQGPDDNAVALLAALQQHQEQEAEYLMRDLAVKVPLRFNFALEILLLPIKRLPPFFVDTRLWKTKHPRKRFQNFRQSCVLLTDRIEVHQSQPDSMT